MPPASSGTASGPWGQASANPEESTVLYGQRPGGQQGGPGAPGGPQPQGSAPQPQGSGPGGPYGQSSAGGPGGPGGQDGPGGPGGSGPQGGPPPHPPVGVGHQAIAPPPAKRKMGKGLLIGLVAGGLVLVLAIVAGAYLIFRDTKGDMVLNYFEALQAANAQEALTYSAEPITDTTLLTDEVLKRSNELGGISQVSIHEESQTWVTVNLKVGNEQQRIQYKVSEGDDGWKLVDAARTYVIPEADLSGVDITVNGAKPSNPASLTLFPGIYEFGTGTPNLAWSEPVQDIMVGIPSLEPTMSVSITDEGKQAAYEGLGKLMAECSKTKELQPENCPFKAQEVPGLVPDSVQWAVDTNPESDWRAIVDGPQMSGTYEYTVRLRFQYQTGGQTRQYDQTSRLSTNVIADLTTDPISYAYGR
ncbi:hypothetical protein [Microlunatus sp. Y2014]|uniref:hypothetical protein n=1 Tax=Microlunatus sp. Y2014 TaxID=3418488 RepID=UPI003DA70830